MHSEVVYLLCIFLIFRPMLYIIVRNVVGVRCGDFDNAIQLLPGCPLLILTLCVDDGFGWQSETLTI
jgi:hypothetical protein